MPCKEFDPYIVMSFDLMNSSPQCVTVKYGLFFTNTNPVSTSHTLAKPSMILSCKWGANTRDAASQSLCFFLCG